MSKVKMMRPPHPLYLHKGGNNNISSAIILKLNSFVSCVVT
jgi:hypothetical protein